MTFQEYRRRYLIVKWGRTHRQRNRDINVSRRHRDPGAKWNRRKDNPHAVPKARHGYT